MWCTEACVTGSQECRRAQVVPVFGGKACPHCTETHGCKIVECPVHPVISAWTAWSTCTKSCGQSAQSRSRTITKVAQHGGYVCPYLAETHNCNQQVGDFSAWSTCTKSATALAVNFMSFWRLPRRPSPIAVRPAAARARQGLPPLPPPAVARARRGAPRPHGRLQVGRSWRSLSDLELSKEARETT